MKSTVWKRALRLLPRMQDPLVAHRTPGAMISSFDQARSLSTTTHQGETPSADASTITDTEADLQTSLFKNPIGMY